MAKRPTRPPQSFKPVDHPRQTNGQFAPKPDAQRVPKLTRTKHPFGKLGSRGK